MKTRYFKIEIVALLLSTLLIVIGSNPASEAYAPEQDMVEPDLTIFEDAAPVNDMSNTADYMMEDSSEGIVLDNGRL